MNAHSVNQYVSVYLCIVKIREQISHKKTNQGNVDFENIFSIAQRRIHRPDSIIPLHEPLVLTCLKIDYAEPKLSTATEPNCYWKGFEH